MLTIFLIFIISLTVYYTGLITKLFDYVRIYNNPLQLEEINTVSKSREMIGSLSREQLQDRAYEVLKNIGIKHIIEIVYFSPDEVLIEIITGEEPPKKDCSNLTRNELEKIGANILIARQCKFNAWEKVKTLTDEELIEVIEEGY